MTPSYLTGQYVQIDGLKYIVLGYSDYKKSKIVVANKHGNKYTYPSRAVNRYR